MRRTGAPTLLTLLLACSNRPVDETADTSTATPDDTSTSTDATAPTSTTSTTTTTVDATSDTSTTTSDPADTTSSPSTSDPATTSTTDPDTTTGDPSPLTCPPAITAAISACVADLQADPELAPNLFLLDLLIMCSDAEPVADDYDAHCAETPGDPICALDYRTFVTDVLPLCVDAAQTDLFADVCLLPTDYDDLLFAPGIALKRRRGVVDDADLTDTEKQQLLKTSAELGGPTGDVAEALSGVDDGAYEQLDVLDVGTDRALVAYTGRYAGALHGRVFFQDTLTVVGEVTDGVFTLCGVERGVEGTPCEDDAPCQPDHACNDVLLDGDVVVAPGVCIDPLSNAEGGCVDHDDCEPSHLCLDTMNEGGTCRPGWMRRSFAGQGAPLTPGGITTIEFTASGLATVPTAGYLDLDLTQTSDNLLALRLTNSTGTGYSVGMSDAQSLHFDLEPVPVQSDESAGGVWQLEIEDLGGQADGTVNYVALTLDTRWD